LSWLSMVWMQGWWSSSGNIQYQTEQQFSGVPQTSRLDKLCPNGTFQNHRETCGSDTQWACPTA
jgi:hypothetical protein